jgi:hydroxyacylglutathione hydrolase
VSLGPQIPGAERRKLGKGIHSVTIEPVAEGVWVVRGGFPKKTFNVYLLEEGGGGVALFDAGEEAMAGGIAAAAEPLGGVRRVVLGHAHSDHRGAAPELGAPVYCHPDEKRYAEAEHPDNEPYFRFELLDRFKIAGRYTMPRLLTQWDGGPVEIAGTVSEGDEVCGFRVVHTPGHAPGLISLWRESDRLALVSDTVYTLDPQTGKPGHPRVPHVFANHDHEQAHESVRKLAGFEPASVWAGHADPMIGDCRAQLEHAAATT